MTQFPPAQVDTTVLRKVIFAAALGNFVEWFDFAVYGFMATQLAARFFPSGDPVTGLLQTFAVFAVAFALRPIGGIFFGTLGDRIGRRRVLSLTILLIAGSTTSIGLLPTHAAAGFLATILLCLARAIQGFSAGGEYAGACAYLLEHCPQQSKARYSSFVPMSTFLSFAFAALASYAMATTLSAEQMSAWGWRVPFLIAAPLGLFGFYIRWRLKETPIFHQIEVESEVARTPLRETVRAHSRTMLKLAGFISATALAFYMFTTYMSTYLQVVAKVSQATALLASVTSLLFGAALSPLLGWLSDRVGRRITMATACGLLIAFVFPAFWLAGHGSLWPILAGQGLFALGTVMTNVVTAVLLSELFPTRVRYTASAVTYNIAYTIFGGTAPFVATYLISETGMYLAPAAYLVGVSIVALACALALPETSKTSLADDPAGSEDDEPATRQHS